MAPPDRSWSETESETYRSLSDYAVPERERQVEIAVALVRAAETDGAVLDLCCGEGRLVEALLTALPDVTVLAYDGSESMLEATRGRAAGLGRVITRKIELADTAWRRFDQPLRAVVSSLAIHHLDGPGKRALFADIHAALAPGGVFVLADCILPATRAGQAIAGDLWDEEVRQRALALDGSTEGFRLFQRADWNHFRHAEPDPIDKPSTLVEQIDWLREAGFGGIDMHWMTAGQMLLSAWRCPHQE